MTSLTDWIGRRDEAEEVVTAGPLSRLAAMLDHADPPWRPNELPPLGHWLFCQTNARQSELGEDGHPRRGGFLPPIALPRRMWAGGSVELLAPIRVGESLRRISTVAKITQKTGRSGDLVFVTVAHEFFCGEVLALREAQELVYRAMPTGDQPAPNDDVVRRDVAQWQRAIRPDPPLLFRFSALTFNGHRIHYDRDYCRDVEGYPGLVVHAPLTVTLMMDLFLRHHPGARVTKVVFRARLPLFDTAPFTVYGAPRSGGASLWAAAADDVVAMTAQVDVA